MSFYTHLLGIPTRLGKAVEVAYEDFLEAAYFFGMYHCLAE